MAELSLVTFNTHYGLRSLHDHATPYDLGAVLVDLAADAMVIQEVWRPDGIRGAVDDFAQTYGYVMHHAATGRATCRRRRWPHHHPDGEGTIGTAILTRVPAQRLPDVLVGPTLGDPAPRRAVVHVALDGGGAGSLQLVGVHLTSRLPHGPPLQLRRLTEALPRRGTAAVVAGDCNLWGPPVVMLLADGWRRTVTGRTWPARRPHSQIDHVLVRPGDVRVLAAEVGADVGSDHRPLRVRVGWPDPSR